MSYPDRLLGWLQLVPALCRIQRGRDVGVNVVVLHPKLYQTLGVTLARGDKQVKSQFVSLPKRNHTATGMGGYCGCQGPVCLLWIIVETGCGGVDVDNIASVVLRGELKHRAGQNDVAHWTVGDVHRKQSDVDQILAGIGESQLHPGGLVQSEHRHPQDPQLGNVVAV